MQTQEQVKREVDIGRDLADRQGNVTFSEQGGLEIFRVSADGTLTDGTGKVIIDKSGHVRVTPAELGSYMKQPY